MVDNQFGASFSVPYARYLGVDPRDCLIAALDDLSIKRLRLMSYWNLHEAQHGTYDFTELDWQFELAQQFGAKVSLAIGLRQPRWPESHWPGWAKKLPKDEWQQALLNYITAVIERYKDHSALESWQLENEAMLKNFGKDGDFDRKRHRAEFKLVKSLDSSHPVIMTTSDSWGIPWFGPKPDIYGFSIYRYFYDRGAYRHSSRPPLFYRVRAALIRLIKWRRVFIHELQAEPWGPKAIPGMTLEEQMVSMSLDHFKEAIAFATKTNLHPTYLWGLEWWYWLKIHHNKPDFWDHVRQQVV